MCSSAPDTSGINAAAASSAEVARDALTWYTNFVDSQAPDRAAASERAGRVSDAQLEAMTEATRQARATSDFQDRTLRPLQQSMVDDANEFDTEQKREELAGLALGDVNQSYANAREQGTRALTRMGVNPNDGRFGAVAGQLAHSQALAGADAKNKARTGALTLGHALKSDAVAALSGLPGNSATQAGLALSSGNSSVNNAQVPLQVQQTAATQMGQGFNTAIQGNNSSGNLYGQALQLGQSNDDALWGAVGNIAGRAAGAYFSDKKLKKGRRPVKGEVALAAARKMPVDSWQYKKGSIADDGGKTHVGPMAQDVQAAAGDHVAPGGKVIDSASMHGVTLASIQQLDKNQKKLERTVIALGNAVRKSKATA